jgi:hypothetical protein
MKEDMMQVLDGNTWEKQLKARWLQGYKTGKRVQRERLLKLLDSLEIYYLETETHQPPFRMSYRELRDLIKEQLK